MLTALRLSRRARRAITGWVTAVTLTAPMVACNTVHDALNVTAPDQIDSSKLQDPQYATLLVNSTIGDFECAYGAFVTVGGLLSGELTDVSITASRWTYDRRDLVSSESAYSQNACDNTTPGVYTPISTARFTADNVANLLSGWTDAQVPNRIDLLAKAQVYAGYDRIMLGELFCSAAIDLGPELTSQQIFALAEDQFTKALANATTANDANLISFAHMGRARARLDQGNLAGADADAKLVPAGFIAVATADTRTGVRNNRVYSQFNGGLASVAPAYIGLTVPNGSGGQVPDTRIQDSLTTRRGADAASPLTVSNKYRTASTPITIGSYAEAQLIIAEAEGGQVAVNIINNLRTSAGLPGAFASTDPVAIKAEVIKERSRVLYLQGEHAYDVRRLSLPLVPAPGTAYAHGGSYGTNVCLPLPDVERNNNPTLKH